MFFIWEKSTFFEGAATVWFSKISRFVKPRFKWFLLTLCFLTIFTTIVFFSGKSRWIDRVVQFTVTDRILMIRSEMLSTPSEASLSRKSFPHWDRNAGAYDNSTRNIILDHLSLYEAWCHSVSNPCSPRLAPCLRKGHKNFFENTRGALITRAKVDPQNPILLW